MADALARYRVLLSLVGFVVAWALASWGLDDVDTLPGPVRVLNAVLGEARNGELGLHVTATLGRVVAAFTVAMVIGTALGALLGRWRSVDAWLFPWVSLFLNIPALVVIVLCYLWIGLNEVAAIAAVAINKTAMVGVTLREGVRSLDPALSDLARVQRLSLWTRAAHISGPQLWPYFATSMRNGLAVIWKIVLVVEFLGRSNGVGFQIHLYFQLFDTTMVLAYALSFTAVMLAVEYALLHPWERRARAWQVQSA